MTKLFGGHISIVDLPPEFIDVSKIRPVPDTQEVFIRETVPETAELDEILIIDLLEQVAGESFDDVMDEHLKDITDDPITCIEKMVYGRCQRWFSYSLVEKGDSYVLILFGLLRLSMAATDVLIQYCIPMRDVDPATFNFENEIGGGNLMVEQAYKIFRDIGESFMVDDWRLFGLPTAKLFN
ncbi:Nuclear import protein MOG1 [Spathaspora sp. JA1]|nr:Nuclear import protein MOG1 [Spathaspora sp. JA1]